MTGNSFNSQIIYIIILCKFFFLFIGRKPTMWPVNNCLQIMVCSCVMSSNFVWLQIIFCSVEMKPCFSPSCDRSCVKIWQITLLPKDSRWKPTWRWNDKTIIELGYCKMSLSVSASQICLPLTNHHILLNIVQ